MTDRPQEKSVGTILREARENKGLSVEDVHQRTRILPQYIQLLEQDNFDFFPEPYIRGFVRSICEELEIDPTPLLERIHELLHPPELEEEEGESATLEPEGKVRVVPAKARRTGDFVIVGLVLLVIGGLVYGYSRYKDKWFGPSARSVQEIPLEQGLVEKKEKPQGEVVTPPKSPVTKLRLGIRTTDSCWVRVVADDSVEYEYLFGPGGQRRIEALEKLYIKTGNAGALILTLNDQEVGSLGKLGEVVELWIDASGKVQKRSRSSGRRMAPTRPDSAR